MEKLVILENKYLMAKNQYYNIGRMLPTTDGSEKEHTTTMEDAEFDELEKYLVEHGSTVVKQVGTKIKDYDFKHPSPMLSLAKIQFSKINDVVDYKLSYFTDWLIKKATVLGISINDILLGYSNKWDGHAINLVYTHSGLNNALTRGDGIYGNDLTSRLQYILPTQINEIQLSKTDILEIRCELVINKKLFKEKYEGKKEDGKYANPRNYMSSVLSPDEYDINKIKELTVKPVHYILNGEHISPSLFENNPILKHSEIYSTISEYENTVKLFEKNRDDNDFQLDGIVITLPIEFRKILGTNNHDPNWSIALKFLSELAITDTIGLDYGIGKTGELTPIALLSPVQLMGTVVRKASCYNIGFVIENKIGKGARICIKKSGDIIPQITNVIIPSDENFSIIDTCPACGNKLEIVGGIHLMCNNNQCIGRKKSQFKSALGKIDIKGVGPELLSGFHSFNDLIDIIVWVRENGDTVAIEEFGLIYGSKSHENFINAFNNIHQIPLSKIIGSLGYAGVGDTIGLQIAKMYSNVPYDFKGLTKELVAMFEKQEIKDLVFLKKQQLEDVGINVIMEVQMEQNNDVTYVVLTGSPKEFGYKTKEEFLLAHPNLVDVGKLTDKRCNLLITDDLESVTSKMSDAIKRNIKIITYGDF